MTPEMVWCLACKVSLRRSDIAEHDVDPDHRKAAASIKLDHAIRKVEPSYRTCDRL